MKILIKGGVWKNSEDEILKAAVMKYGKNQWARVASLLNRKSSKQCKARWYEWLDPSVKKTEWSREEEEKLLHLAKLMPNQWRTIAPIVGRTASQCMEHYERLLDQAQEEQGDSARSSLEEARKLRPGEIDPTPETKPARPDPIDMDADEKEMLSEARARLANTKGKKAKRKARERQLDESRRLSLLQKRRELKAAGIESSIGLGHKRKYLDYSREIPFQKTVPSGFYDISEENSAHKKLGLDPKKHVLELAVLEGQQARNEEERERKNDQKKFKSLVKENAPLALLKVSQDSDPAAFRRRSGLVLPEPQVTPEEVEALVKMGGSGNGKDLSSSSLSSMLPPSRLPASMLTGAQPLGSTPLRTPRREDVLLQEAKQQLLLRQSTSVLNQLDESNGDNQFDSQSSGSKATPLAASLPVEALQRGGTGMQSATPRRDVLVTPNSFLGTSKPMTMTSSSSASSTISTLGSSSLLKTPIRDSLGLNQSSMASTPFSSVGRDDLEAFHANQGDFTNSKKLMALGLAQQLANLPAPEYSYEIQLPSLSNTNEEALQNRGSSESILDQNDIARAEQLRRAAEESAELQLKSEVFRRQLPRPEGGESLNALLDVPWPSMDACSEEVNSNEMRSSDRLSHFANRILGKSTASISTNVSSNNPHQQIWHEMISWMIYEEFHFPRESLSVLDSSSAATTANLVPQFDLHDISIEERIAADNLIQVEDVMEGNNRSNNMEKRDLESSFAEFREQWLQLHRELNYIPSRRDWRGRLGCFGIPEDKKDVLSALSTQYSSLKAKYDKDVKKGAKLENKHTIMTNGYISRCDKLQQTIHQALELEKGISNELAALEYIHEMEKRMIPERLKVANFEVKQALGVLEKRQRDYQVLMDYTKN